MSKMTSTTPTDAVCSASSNPAAKRTASQRGTVRLRHRATPMITGATNSPKAYASVNPWPGPELKFRIRIRAPASWLIPAVAAAARLMPTSTLTMAPQNAPIPPISTAMVAAVAPRFRTSMAIAAYETATAPSASSDSDPETNSCVECRAAIGSTLAATAVVVTIRSVPRGSTPSAPM
jgi:hypothetical protein